MKSKTPGRVRAMIVWAGLATAVIAPVAVAATSPLIAWRDPVYITACFSGIAALGLLLFQPLLAAGTLPGLSARRSRQIHHGVGAALVLAVAVHVGGLWITSPPDVIDALFFRSPTPFSPWGVIAMWAVFGSALLAALSRRLRMQPRLWRLAHKTLAAVIVTGTAVHALLIEGLMGTVTKAALCLLVLIATLKVLARLADKPRRCDDG